MDLKETRQCIHGRNTQRPRPNSKRSHCQTSLQWTRRLLQSQYREACVGEGVSSESPSKINSTQRVINYQMVFDKDLMPETLPGVLANGGGGRPLASLRSDARTPSSGCSSGQQQTEETDTITTHFQPATRTMEEPAFASDPEALNYYRSLARGLQSDLDDTKLALDEFQASSKELEAELEKELQATEKQLKDLRGREENLLHEIDQWKTKYHASLKDHTKTMSHMQTELESCRKSNEEYRTRLRDMELDNDELEGKERMVTSSLQDVEMKYGKAIERITLLEDEIIGKSKLEEEHQRLKDDFRDMMEELAILREHLANPPQNSSSPALRGEAASAHVSSSPSSSPITVRECSETEFGSPGLVETLKDAEELPSPLRPIMRTKPASTVTSDSLRRRLASTGPLSETSSRSPVNKSPASSEIRKAGSLRVTHSNAAKKSLQSVYTPEPSIGISTNTTTSNVKSSRNSYSRNQASPLLNTTTNSSTSTTSNRGVSNNNNNTSKSSSHIQSLRAETQRMQGMTKKIVGSRVLRTGSAIPVRKTFSLTNSSSIHPHTKSNLHVLSTLNQSQHVNSPKRNQAVVNSGVTPVVRNTTQPAPSQDVDSDSNSNSAPSHHTTGVPRARLTRPLSRLSTGSSDLHLSTGIPIMTTSSSNENTNNTLLPRRKASIDLTFDRHKFNRPLSIQDGIKDQPHLRRQSVGLVHSSSLNRSDHHPLSKSNLNHYPLGKSLSNSASSRPFPVKKSS